MHPIKSTYRTVSVMPVTLPLELCLSSFFLDTCVCLAIFWRVHRNRWHCTALHCKELSNNQALHIRTCNKCTNFAGVINAGFLLYYTAQALNSALTGQVSLLTAGSKSIQALGGVAVMCATTLYVLQQGMVSYNNACL